MAYTGKERIELVQPSGDYRLIPLTRGKVALVSVHRFSEFNSFHWCVTQSKNSGFYAIRRTPDGIVRMHRQILGLPISDMRLGDHINHDTLDNRDENLRIANRAQNQRNKQKTHVRHLDGRFKGVYFHKQNNCLRVKIGHMGKTIHVGCFPIGQEEEAARAYDAKARELYGEFACLNFP
jgi:hypothetical protein